MDYTEFKQGVGKRLKSFIKSKNYNQKEFGELIGVKDGALSAVINGGGMSSEIAYKIACQFQVDWNWLFTGQESAIDNRGNVVLGENNGLMQVNNQPASMEVLVERVRALEEQLRLKDEIIQLLKK